MLTRVGEAGVDMFAKDEPHLALCFQGHPEYDGDTLAREFRRDVGRALPARRRRSRRDHYYPPEIEGALRAHLDGMLAGGEAPHLPDYA